MMPRRTFLLLAIAALTLVTLDSSGVQELEIIPFLIDFRDSRIVEADLEDAQVIMNYFK